MRVVSTSTGGGGRLSPFRRVMPIALSLAVPLALAVAWIPVRTRLPNVDLALLLTVAVAAIGTLGSQLAVASAAVSAALWFEFFDTAPFERLAIARNPDIETTLLLVVVAAMVGELSFRVARHRSAARSESDKFDRVRTAAEAVASGEELAAVIDLIADELSGLLGLRHCLFESGPCERPLRRLTRAGDLVAAGGLSVSGGPPADLLLPVTVQGEEVGGFVMSLPEGSESPSRDRLVVALTLADTLGAAFLAQAPPPLPPDREPKLRLRLAGRGDGRGPAHAAAGSQETSGFASMVG